ncbi:MAG: 50S ribosomal protein L11 methyltransferase, partial [Candidatus Puniceispirillaceae bacterium]
HDAPDSSLIEETAARALSQPEQADIQLEFVPEHDWLAENRKSFPPLTIGCFWIYGSHVTAPVPKTLLPILIDAAQAFGSGTHPTTEGCLRALSDIRQQRKRPQKILDMGCGSAILAIAASHLFPGASVMAADNDAISVRTAAENRRLNNISPRQMKTVLSAGFSNRAVSKNRAYDVILANILARPLRLMAADLTRHLAPNGQLVLSGLLTSQVNWVMQAYLGRGMRLKRHIIIGDWSCLVLISRRKKGAL